MKLGSSVINNIDRILENAAREERTSLFEYEVYQILQEIGLEVPKFIFISDSADIKPGMFHKFGKEAIVKIVSPQIAHKQVVGGVKKVKIDDYLYVQFVLKQMREEVLSHFNESEKPEIRGFLIVEYVSHTQALGNEVLIGFKEDPAFGPVLTLSKGGDDAEFFAKYFNPANLLLPPFEPDVALEMLQVLNIKHKYQQIGHPEYLEYMAKAVSAMSYLAYTYSFIADEQPKFIFKSMDINPFVFANDRFVAIDGFAEFIPASESDMMVPRAEAEELVSFFRPKGVAVIGVSSDLNKYSLGREIAKSLHEMDRNDLFFVNSHGGELKLDEKTYPLYRHLPDLPQNVELVIYAAPAQYMADFIFELKPGLLKSLILISGLPSDLRYADFAKQITRLIPPGVRMIGPNCMGVFFAPDQKSSGLNTLFVDEQRLEIKYSDQSNTVLLTQSGALAVTAIDKLQNAKIFRAIVSFGNKLDVKISDLLSYFAKEEGIEVIALYLEGLDPGEGRQFFELACEIKKPIIVYKAGKTEAGARAAASHTASMSGKYEVFKASCEQAGVLLAETIDEHYNLVKAFALLTRKRLPGNRVAGVVNAGFESTVGADELQDLKQAQLAVMTVSKLNEINKFGLVDTSSPFLDITPMADDKMYADFVEAILQDDGVDCVFVAVVPHAASLKTIPETCFDPDSLANRLVGLSKKYSKPMVISVNAGRYYQDFVSILEENGLPVYGDIRSAIKSLDAFVSYRMEKGK